MEMLPRSRTAGLLPCVSIEPDETSRVNPAIAVASVIPRQEHGRFCDDTEMFRSGNQLHLAYGNHLRSLTREKELLQRATVAQPPVTDPGLLVHFHVSVDVSTDGEVTRREIWRNTEGMRHSSSRISK
jgi:hypothetical protein